MPSYPQLLALAALAVGLLVAIYFLRSRWRAKPQGLHRLLSENPAALEEAHRDLVMPLLVWEERNPPFGRILALVLSHFSLGKFLRDGEFERALRYLREAVSRTAEPRAVNSAMGVVVRTFVSDPDVSYRCRGELVPLVEEFLRAIEGEERKKRRPSAARHKF